MVGAAAAACLAEPGLLEHRPAMRPTVSRRRRARLAAACLAFATLACADEPTRTDGSLLSEWAVAPELRVAGNQLVEASSGRPVRLRGVSVPGTESACVRGTGVFAGPADSLAVEAMRAWKVNAVRVPLNASCWLGLPGVPPAYAGAAYRDAIAAWVALLERRGMVVILSLDWTGTATTVDAAQRPMPERATAPTFWMQVAQRFGADDRVLLDLYAAPWPNGNRPDDEAWRCWRDGGACGFVPYEAAGMQELVTAIRNTGATSVILVAGVQYGGGLTQWLARRPFDPRGNLAASWRIFDNYLCNRRSCWDSWAGAVAREVPLVLAEFGDIDGEPAFPAELIDFMDERGGHWLAAGWGVTGAPSDLVQAWDGTPTAYGATFRARLAQ
jgi:endoglucanase